MTRQWCVVAAVLLAALWLVTGQAYAAGGVLLADLTTDEVATALASGTTTVIVPTGGIEQNGPHLSLNKHNLVVAETARRIATTLGHTLVAPVVPFVPEGRITPPTGHMRHAGTLSVREATFAALLTDLADSLRQQGFTLIVFIGDSGGNQAIQQAVAQRLNRRWRWRGQAARVLHVSDYYAANGQTYWLQHQGGLNVQEIGTHAGVRETAELLACAPDAVRQDQRRPAQPGDTFDGNPTLATREWGEVLLTLKVEAAVRQVRNNLPTCKEKKCGSDQ
jgi:creatinine amidohydrolase/Fe(II)-dependent formamide hydrolase-like protein